MKTSGTSLQDLGGLKKELAAQRARAAEEAHAHAEAVRRRQAGHTLFSQAMRGVEPLHTPPRAASRPPAPEPRPLQRERDNQAVLRESLSDEFDVSTLLSVDGYLSFSRPGIGADVPADLRRGRWAVQAQVDLHGLRRDEARTTLSTFLHDARAGGLRCVRVIHGKGLGSPGGVPVLKDKVHGWLIQKKDVLAFTQARSSQGGAGALLVLLAPADSTHPQRAAKDSAI